MLARRSAAGGTPRSSRGGDRSVVAGRRRALLRRRTVIFAAPECARRAGGTGRCCDVEQRHWQSAWGVVETASAVSRRAHLAWQFGATPGPHAAARHPTASASSRVGGTFCDVIAGAIASGLTRSTRCFCRALLENLLVVARCWRSGVAAPAANVWRRRLVLAANVWRRRLELQVGVRVGVRVARGLEVCRRATLRATVLRAALVPAATPAPAAPTTARDSRRGPRITIARATTATAATHDDANGDSCRSCSGFF